MKAARGRLHIGRRGACLLFFGGLDLIYALRLLAPDAETASRSQFRWLASMLPLWVWAAVWATVGVILLVHAFRRSDRAGFTAAILLKVAWGSLSFGGWATGNVPSGYVSAAIWLAASLLVGVIAGWPEPGDGRGPTWTRPSP